eukprot:621715-Pleurochrysis_carterae.AAC.1
MQEAVPDATIHPIMKYTHDWTTFFDSDIYDSVEQVNTARECILRKRDDGGVLARTSLLPSGIIKTGLLTPDSLPDSKG